MSRGRAFAVEMHIKANLKIHLAVFLTQLNATFRLKVVITFPMKRVQRLRMTPVSQIIKLLASSFFMIVSISALSPSAVAQAADSAFQPGLYSIRSIGPAGSTQPPSNLCIQRANTLLQLVHRQVSGCKITSSKTSANKTTITYSCPNNEWGRTELRKESSILYQMDTQGIKDKAPFSYRLEVRRSGACNR